MRKLNAWKLAGAVLMFCAATAIAAPAQTFDDLLDFDGRDGANPGYGFLVQGHDGNFYGTTMAAGGNLRKSEGTVFEITPSGRLVTLYSFCPIFPRCPDGDGPSGLVLGTDGNFYGTTASAGANQRQSMPGGTVFRITPQGQLTTLYSFCAEPSCLDGTIPLSWLVEGADGNFYGTTTAGGAGVCSSQGCGTVFKITPSGKLTTPPSFFNTFP